MYLMEIPLFPWLVDMLNTMVMFVAAFSSPSSHLPPSVGTLHPPLKHKLEDDLTCNGGQKKGSPSLGKGSTLSCAILVMEASLASPKFVTISFDKINGGSWAPPSYIA